MTVYEGASGLAIVLGFSGTWIAARHWLGWWVCIVSSAMWVPTLVNGAQWIAVLNCCISMVICFSNVVRSQPRLSSKVTPKRRVQVSGSAPGETAIPVAANY